MRCGVIGFLQESNTFVQSKTGLADFAADVLLCGEDVRDRFVDAPHELGGFFAGLEQEGIDAVPLFAARALPGGVIESRTLEHLLAKMEDSLEQAGQLDGLLVAPHGATASENVADVDGYWLAGVREQLGPRIPIVGTIDPHANLSEQMVTACDALIAYRTNPHIDQRECGQEAARLLARTLGGEVHPVMAVEFPPMTIGIAHQATGEPPCRDLYCLADEVRRASGVLSTSIVLGFPYADVPEMGSSVIVVTDGEEQLAHRHASQLAEAMWSKRQSLNCRESNHSTIDAAIDAALTAKPPVCLLDMGDNVGGGSPGDSVWLASALHARRVSDSVVAICDAAAVQAAAAAGVGTRISLSIGSQSGPLSGAPLHADFTVRGLYSGRFHESEPTHGGFTSFDQGPSAVLVTDDGLSVLVSSRRMAPFSLAQLTSCGLNPAKCSILVAKGVNAPIASYSKVCRTFIRVDTPGVTTADVTRMRYQRRRRPMFPFEAECEWSAEIGRG